MQRILNVEFGGMQEALYNLADLTGDDRWARTGDRFTKKVVFNPLASFARRAGGAAHEHPCAADHRRGQAL